MVGIMPPVKEDGSMVEQHKKTKGRSPNYPGISLELALGKTEALLKENGPNFVPADVAISDMGYAPKSGPGTITLAALKKFGLIDEDGRGETRRVRVSDLARSILVDEPVGSVERAKLLQMAALNPPLHQSIWSRYPGGLPGDGSILFDLQKGGFTRSGAEDFLRQFKSTMQYADLDSSASMSDDDEAETDQESHKMTTGLLQAPAPDTKAPPGSRVLNLPISRTRSAVLQLPGDLDEAGWAQMMRTLEVMKQAILSEHEEDQPD
jgi:hypothetical protein